MLNAAGYSVSNAPRRLDNSFVGFYATGSALYHGERSTQRNKPSRVSRKRRFMSGRIAVSTTVKISLNSFLRHFFSGRPRSDWSTKSNEETSSGTGRN